MNNGGLILWGDVPVCEVSNASWKMGKLPVKDGLQNHSNGQKFLLEQWLNINRFQHEINQDFISLARNFYQEAFLGMH